jgi:hypothetical protein
MQVGVSVVLNPNSHNRLSSLGFVSPPCTLKTSVDKRHPHLVRLPPRRVTSPSRRNCGLGKLNRQRLTLNQESRRDHAFTSVQIVLRCGKRV